MTEPGEEYVDDTLEEDDDAPFRVNFTGVSGQRAFHLLPRGKYIAAVTDFTKTKVGSGDNRGKPMINWEFTIESTFPGLLTEVMAKVRKEDPITGEITLSDEEIKVEGRRLYDNMTIMESTFWRFKAFLEAQWFDASEEVEIFPAQIVEMGVRMVLEVGVQKGKPNRETKEKYPDRNVIRAFHALPEEKPVEAQVEATPSTVAAEVPVEEEKSRKKTTKANAETEAEAKV